MGQLNGKVVVLTGGEGILGQAVTAALDSAGAQVASLDRAPAGASACAAALRINGLDLGNPAEAVAAMVQVVERFGRLDALVNVAGGFTWEPATNGSIDTWDLMYQINVRTAVIASQAALPQLLKQGRGSIVNIGSLAAMQAGNGMAAYAASKSGVARFTEGLAEELKDKGINVNAVLPSILDTPTNRKDMPDADFSRWVTPQQVARVIAFLVSADAQPITGALLPVRGRV